MSKRPDDLIYAVDERPPLFTLAALGLQQVCVISIYLVLLVIVAKAAHASTSFMQSMVSVGMLSIAIATILQSLWKGPIGSGYLAPPVFSAIYLQPSILAAETGGLSLVFGMTALAGAFEVFISKIFNYLRNLFPPIISGLIVIAVGLELGLLGASELIDVKGELSSERILPHVLISTLTLALMVSLTIWGSGWFRLLSPLIGILIGWLVSYLAGIIPPENLDVVRNAPMIGIPKFNYVGYSFDLNFAVPFLICGLAGGLRTIGVITTAQRINDSIWKRPNKKSIQGGIFADGLGCLIGGLLGGTGMSTSPSAVGISQFTQATSRYIAFAIAGWYLLLACLPKVTSMFITIPPSVVGATLLYTGSMLLVSGIKIITTHPLDVRKTFIIGISLFLGLSHKITPDYFTKLPTWIQMFTGTTLSITTLTALVLHSIFRLKLKQTGEVIIANDADLPNIDETIVNNVKKWGGKTEEAEDAVSFLNILCKEIIDHGYAAGPINAKMTYDPLNLIVDLSYKGKMIDIHPESHKHPDAMLDEMPMAIGLSSYLIGVHPDKITSKSENGTCYIKYEFEL